MKLRPYQQDLFQQVISSSDNLLVQLDTGAGKTPIIAKLAEHYEHVAIVCHRNILIKQASEKLAMCGVEHAIMAGNEIKKISATNNFDETGKHFISQNSDVVLISIDTFNSKLKTNKATIDNSKEWIILIDEAHHLATDNKWWKIFDYLQCRMIGFTATPVRGDGQPMLKKFNGLDDDIEGFNGSFDRIVQAKGYENNATEMLIAQGYLSEYVAYYCEPIEYDENWNVLDETSLTASNFNGKIPGVLFLGLGRNALRVVKNNCRGRKTLVVFPRIEVAERFVEKAKEINHRAETIHSKLPQYEIQRILEAFEKGHIDTLVSVDMVNEGFDLPAVNALVLARDIKSFGFYRQVCGRVLRPSDKDAVIYDLTGTNIAKHGLPSDPINWNERQEDQRRYDLRICPNCSAYTKKTLRTCSNCGEYNCDYDTRNGEEFSVSVKVYASKMIKACRQEVQAREVKRIKEEQQAQAKKERESTYMEHSCTFNNTLIGKRCKHFFDTLKQELKYLSCKDYNDFFIKNLSNFKDMQFYVGVFSANFDNDKTAQCKKLYEKRK